MFRPIHRFMVLILAASALAGLTGCGGERVEDSKAFQDMATEVNDLRTQVQNFNNRLITLEVDVNQINDELTLLKDGLSMGQSSPAVEKRMGDMQEVIQGLRSDVARLRDELQAVEKKAASGPRASTSSSSSTSRSPDKPSASAASGGATTRARAAAPGSTANPRDKGGYHTVKEGETIESIAAANGVTPDAIRKANRISGSRQPVAGARIFIPAP